MVDDVSPKERTRTGYFYIYEYAICRAKGPRRTIDSFLSRELLMIIFGHRGDEILLETALKQECKWKTIPHAGEQQIPKQDRLLILLVSPGGAN